jgi:hypothetical protein
MRERAGGWRADYRAKHLIAYRRSFEKPDVERFSGRRRNSGFDEAEYLLAMKGARGHRNCAMRLPQTGLRLRSPNKPGRSAGGETAEKLEK